METLEREEFLKLNIKDQAKYINSKTVEGKRVVDIAKELNIGDKGLRGRLKKSGYTFNRNEKKYILDSGITKESEGKHVEITKVNKIDNNEVTKVEVENKHKEVIKVEEKKDLFNEQEVSDIKELLAMKERIVNFIVNPILGNSYNSEINITELLQTDRSARKKATFNINQTLLQELKEYSEGLINISISDLANAAIKEYLDHHKKGVKEE